MEMQALASLPNYQLNCCRAFSWKCYRASVELLPIISGGAMGSAVALLFILVCGVALLQSKLIKAAGDWTSSYLLGGRMGGEPPHELRLPGALGLFKSDSSCPNLYFG